MPYSKLDSKIIALTERVRFKLALFGAAMMTILGSVLVSPALPGIAKEFSTTPHIELLTGLTLTIPALFMIFFSPIAGALMDKFGKLKFLYPAMILWIFAGVSGAWCADIYTLLLSRCAFGIASAFITTGANALLGDYYAVGEGRRDRALSLQGFVMALGGAVLTIIAGYFTSFSWRYAFYVYASGLFVFVFCLFYLFEPRVAKNKATQNAANADKKVFYKDYASIYFAGFFVVMIFYLAAVQFPHYIEDTLGLNPKFIGFAMASTTLSHAVVAYLYKDIVKFLSIKQIYVLGFALQAFGFLLVFLVDDFIVAIVSLAIFGAVGGLIVTNNSAYLFQKAPQSVRARAYGGLASCVFLGQFISPIITTPMVSSFGLKAEFGIWVVIILLVSLIYARLNCR